MVSTPFVAVPPQDYGGTELVIYDLVEGLVGRGHHVTLFATGDSNTRAQLRARFKDARWPPHPCADLDHASWAIAEIVEDEFDIVHVHSPPALAVARTCPELRLVYTIHHSHESPLSEFYRDLPDIQFVAISRDQASREPGLARLAIIHHGLDPSRYQAADRSQDYVCFIGRLNRDKGPHTAIDVARMTGVPIRVAGTVHPPDEAYAHELLAPRLRQPHVQSLGAIDHATKAPLLRDARALLAPIEWDEPFGLAMIEAMLSGCPVVAFSRGSVPELVEPGITGFIARSPEDMAAIIAPSGPVEEVDRLRCRARALERFGSSRLVSEYEQLYRRVIGEADSGTPMPPSSAA